jgi:glycosyltransferase involved in cell wall biosynthesis
MNAPVRPDRDRAGAVAVSVIVPARDASATLERTLAALAAQDLDRGYEVIVVDDGSRDGTGELAEASTAVDMVLRQPPSGPGPARNRGVAAARASALAFTDADCMPAPEWLREGLGALEDAELVQGLVRPDPEARPGPFDRSIAVGNEGGLYETANLFVTRDLFDRLGGFEDWLRARLGKPLGEDLWFGWKARRAGARTAFCERAVVDHAVIPRGPAAYIAERARLAYFPAIAGKIPELREGFFFARIFLSSRTAAFDAALFSTALALRSSSPLPAVGAWPYARSLAKRALPWGREAPHVAAVEIAADVVGLVALLVGSIRRRSALL